jgi:hypothetical protein
LSKLVIDNLGANNSAISRYNNGITNRFQENFEHLLTYLSTDLPWKNEEEVYTDKALYSQITNNIHKIFWDKAWESLEEREKICNKYNALFSYFVNNMDKINFITLNYDLLLEILLQYSFNLKSPQNNNDYLITSAKMYHYPMTWIGLRSQLTGMTIGDENDRDTPQILKLHGSVNWYWSKQNSSETIYYKNLDKREYDIRLDAGLVPFIIPPVMDKNGFYNHILIKSLWQRAKQILWEASEIYIIGFSFPQTDTSIRFLFQSIVDGPFKEVYIVNKTNEQNHETVTNNYLQILGKDYGPNFDFVNGADVLYELGKFLGRKDNA